ncbi:MAG: nicotinate-nucleotide--dimethylbenzimidazole phosphoribosyltransferase [Planctomycetota bacterium]|nr:nicotinate-nucleotide--dimethylbenzimidazole phosphoribosyltransferase [Planctomycetota bacterium]
MNILERAIASIEPAEAAFRTRARARLEKLTMPHWAMGRLMDLAEELAGMTRSLKPPTEGRVVVTMAGDHGVTAEGVSRYPPEVTPQMVRNFVAGGAGINAMARVAGARVVVVDMGVAAPLDDLAAAGKIVSKKIAPGTGNIARGPAMSRQQAIAAIEAGIGVAFDLAPGTDLFATGDMGIGNTTPSAAIAAAVLGSDPAAVTGRGTGIDDSMLARKIETVRRALAVNRPDPRDGVDVLARVGGFEIGGIAGLILGAAALRRPVIVDGFISSAGALIASLLAPASADYMIASHKSAERGHTMVLERLGKKPLLDLDMRLGEGTGAALAMPLVEAAARLLTDVSTFEEASVSGAVG